MAETDPVVAAVTGTVNGRPIWFQILDRFGLPTFFVFVMIGILWIYNKQVRADTAVERTAFIESLQENTAAVHSLDLNVRETNGRIDALTTTVQSKIPAPDSYAPKARTARPR